MTNKSQAIRLISVVTALIVAISGAGVGGWFLKSEDINSLEEANKAQDEVLGKTVYKTLDLEADVIEIKTEVKQMCHSLDSMRLVLHGMNIKLDILVEGYSGD